LFKEKDLDNTEGTERLSPTAANFHEYAILFKHSRQSQQQRNAVTPVKPGELDQLTLHHNLAHQKNMLSRNLSYSFCNLGKRYKLISV